ncbi:Armadillo-like helical domain containing protein [Gracilaria domingensis]|nr:Armadillo-like helical domain containing protein [Gracilaria domingensis]
MVAPAQVQIILDPKHPQRPQVDSILLGITNNCHLQRDRVLSHLSVNLSSMTSEDIYHLRQGLLNVMRGDNPWYALYGACVAASKLLQTRQTAGHFKEQSDQFPGQLLKICETLLTHSEPRVREAVSQLIQHLAVVEGTSTWTHLVPLLIGHIEHNFTLDESQRLKEASRVAARELDEHAADSKLHGLRMVHETEGWKGLETMLLCFASLADGCGKQMFIDSGEQSAFEVHGVVEIIQFVDTASSHPNRFVREAGLKVIKSLAAAAGSVDERFVVELVERCAPVIAKGLQDNWSQVRFAASVATRTIMSTLNVDEKRRLYPSFLPRMCLNRHYVAEGVRNYSQYTWRHVIAEDGRFYLERYMDECITFYESQCLADNHAVREAACQSLGEAALRLKRETVSPFIARVIAGLVGCFKDESWPVRDHACQALADVISEFSEIAEQTGSLSETFELFRAHLADNIPSVRENCANSFEKASCVFDVHHSVIGTCRLADVVKEFIVGVESQKESEKEIPRVCNTQYGASTQLAVDDVHTNQVMYSCGSLAPKLRRGGGCMDHGFVRKQEPWEESDGGVLLWRALMRNARSRGVVAPLFDKVVEAGVVGGKKTYNGRMRFLNRFVDVLAETAEWVPKDHLCRQLDNLVIIYAQTKDLSEVSSRKAGEYRRCLQRRVGIRDFAAAEKRVKDQGSISF